MILDFFPATLDRTDAHIHIHTHTDIHTHTNNTHKQHTHAHAHAHTHTHTYYTDSRRKVPTVILILVKIIFLQGNTTESNFPK